MRFSFDEDAGKKEQKRATKKMEISFDENAAKKSRRKDEEDGEERHVSIKAEKIDDEEEDNDEGFING